MRLSRFLPARARMNASIATGALLLCGSACAPSPLRAQTVQFAGGKPAVDVGTANLCHTGATETGCSVTTTLTYRVTGAGTLGEPRVLTLGTGNLDFTLVAQGTTCQGAVTAGQTCTVAVKFAPRFVGGRRGGVRMVDSTGGTLASTSLYGAGRGPQVEFDLNRLRRRGSPSHLMGPETF